MTLADNAIGPKDGHRDDDSSSPSAVFAACAGSLSLSGNPTGGIDLWARLSTDPAVWFDPIAFQPRSTVSSRGADSVRHIPVFLVTRHNTGSAGAIRLA